MVNMVFEGRAQTGQTALDFGITDLIVVEGANGPVVYASSGNLGGLSAFTISGSGSATMVDYMLYDGSWADGVLDNLAVITVNDAPSVVVAGSGQHDLRLFGLDTDGTIGAQSHLQGVNTSTDQILGISQRGSDVIFLSDTVTGEIQGYDLGSNGMLFQTETVADTAATYVTDAIALETVQVGGAQFLISVSQEDRGVSTFFINGSNQLFNTSNQGVNEGLGFMTPTDSAVVHIGDRAFVIIASAPDDGSGQSGAISVLEIAADGSLVPTDHLNDTMATRFGQVQTLEAIEHEGRHYVIAGGGDDGLTLFAMMPNGRLQLLDVMVSDSSMPLTNARATTAVTQGDTLHLYVASEAEGGFAQISVDLASQGETYVTGHVGGTQSGGMLDDIIVGGAGNDSLFGDSGDDIIEDGHGSDTLNGGDGADTFVLRADGTADTIVDFQQGIDKLDLSDWPMFYGASQIDYTATATGAILSWRGETVEVFTRDGQTLTLTEVHEAIMETADRAPDFEAIFGNGGAQSEVGSALDDVFVMGGGADTVTGAAGDDFVDGGADNDWLEGGSGHDTILGGAGDDRQIGGLGNDSLNGDDGNDTLEGGDGVDTLVGGSGDDVLLGGASSDTLLGLAGADTLDGGEGTDMHLVQAGDTVTDSGTVGYDRAQVLDGNGATITMTGWSGVERINGNTGNDHLDASMLSDAIFLFGQGGSDTLEGGTGSDTILGGDGDDEIRGGAGDDILQGEAGNDTFFGGAGDDYIYVGEAGDVVTDAGDGFDRVFINNASGLDLNVGTWTGVERYVGFTGDDRISADGSPDNLILVGAEGNDTLIGGLGQDTVYAGIGNDLIEGGSGNDVLIGGGGNDTINGGAGNDFMLGESGADHFVFDDAFGDDIVKSFERGVDQLDFSDVTGVSGIGDLVISTVDGNTTVALASGGTDRVTIADVATGLSVDDFIF